MATLDAPKVLVVTNKTKLTLTVALTLTDTVTVIFFYVFFRSLTFYPFADKNSIVSSYFIVEKRFFVGIYKKKGLGLLNDGHFAYGTLRLLDSSPTVWLFRLLDTSPTGHFAYWTFRLLPGQFAYRLLFILPTRLPE